MSTKEPSPPDRGGRSQPANFLRQLALALELPAIPVAGVLVGGGLGTLIDRWAHTRPVFTLLLGAIGFGMGIWDVIQRASRQEKNNGTQ